MERVVAELQYADNKKQYHDHRAIPSPGVTAGQKPGCNRPDRPMPAPRGP